MYPNKLRNYLNSQDGIFVCSPNGSQFGYNGGYYFPNMALALTVPMAASGDCSALKRAFFLPIQAIIIILRT